VATPVGTWTLCTANIEGKETPGERLTIERSGAEAVDSNREGGSNPMREMSEESRPRARRRAGIPEGPGVANFKVEPGAENPDRPLRHRMIDTL
jgi:RNA 3'-terminal phosphate cyclase